MEANPFISDPGPEFDPEAPEQAPAVPLHAVEAYWEADRINRILRAQGIGTHELIGVGREDWLWRDGELQAIADPLANVLNKFPVTHAAAAVSDELTVGAVLFEYTFRSYRERIRVLRARQAQAEEPPPITGYDGAGNRVQDWAPEPPSPPPPPPAPPPPPPAPARRAAPAAPTGPVTGYDGAGNRVDEVEWRVPGEEPAP